MKRYLLLLLALLPFSLTAQLYQPWEELSYRVSYRAKLIPNTEMATVTVKTITEEYNEEECYKVVGHGKTLPAFRIFFTLDDRYTIHVDPKTQRTLRFESDLKEGDYTFRSHYTYDWDSMQCRTWWQSRQRTPQERTLDLTPESMDAISLFFNMRDESADSFQPGEQRTLQLLLEDTVRYLNYRFIGRETKKIRRMGKFHTLKFACQLGTSEGYSFTDGDEFYIWISDDRNKIPLWLESPIKVGSIQAYISELKGLKYPLESMIK